MVKVKEKREIFFPLFVISSLHVNNDLFTRVSIISTLLIITRTRTPLLLSICCSNNRQAQEYKSLLNTLDILTKRDIFFPFLWSHLCTCVFIFVWERSFASRGAVLLTALFIAFSSFYRWWYTVSVMNAAVSASNRLDLLRSSSSVTQSYTFNLTRERRIH